MDLKPGEKNLLVILLKDHLKEVLANEQLLNQQAAVFAAEAKYVDFVRSLIKKFS